MAHAQKPDFVFQRNGRVYLNRRGRQFSQLLTAEVCTSAVVMLDTPCSEVVWRVLATHSIRQFPLHFPSRASPCAITFQLESTFPECVSIILGIQHALRMRHVFFCSLPGSTNISPHYFMNGTIFGKKLLNLNCGFDFLYKFCLTHILFQEELRRYIIKKNYIGLQVQ